MRICCWLWLLLFLAFGCKNYPRDPDKTLEKVQNGKLLVGYSENPPFVIKTAGSPSGIEAELVKEFARSLNAQIEWQNDSEEDLFNRLNKKELHLVIGGITDKNLWKSKISFTRPYLKTSEKKYVMAVRKGENAFILQLEKFLKAQEAKQKPLANL